MSTADSYQSVLFALAIWREMRGASHNEKLGVKHVILNRVAHPSGPFHACPDIVSNIFCPFQFSSFNHGDPNATLLPNPKTADWAAWLECCEVVDSQDDDPTGGANYYHDYPEGSSQWPKWARADKLTVVIGKTKFYKL